MNFEGVISVTCAEGIVTIKVKRSWCRSGCAPGVVYTYGGSASNADYVFNVTGNNVNNDTYKSISVHVGTSKVLSSNVGNMISIYNDTICF